jgi:hypothetical protein
MNRFGFVKISEAPFFFLGNDIFHATNEKNKFRKDNIFPLFLLYLFRPRLISDNLSHLTMLLVNVIYTVEVFPIRCFVLFGVFFPFDIISSRRFSFQSFVVVGDSSIRRYPIRR